MEAKGCAKPAVWKNARRQFYWAVRTRVARSAALTRLTEASPSSTLQENVNLLRSLVPFESTSTQQTAETLEKLDLEPTLTQLRSDNLVRQLRELTSKDRKATLDGLARLLEDLTDEEKSGLSEALQNPNNRSPGASTLASCTK